jgi:hypothetical protein
VAFPIRFRYDVVSPVPTNDLDHKRPHTKKGRAIWDRLLQDGLHRTPGTSRAPLRINGVQSIVCRPFTNERRAIHQPKKTARNCAPNVLVTSASNPQGRKQKQI